MVWIFCVVIDVYFDYGIGFEIGFVLVVGIGCLICFEIYVDWIY